MDILWCAMSGYQCRLGTYGYAHTNQANLEAAFLQSYEAERESDFSASMDALKKLIDLQ